LEFTLKQKIDFLSGIPVRQTKKTYLLDPPLINHELWELLEDLRQKENLSVHVVGYLYQRIMQFTGIYHSFIPILTL
jgi:hypothetical protein